MAKQFTKIVANKNVAIHWRSSKKTASEATETQSHELSCAEKPRPEFETALQAFLPFFLKIIGAPAEWTKGTRVTGVSISREEESDRRGIVITAVRHCPYGAAPIAINTPYLPEKINEVTESSSNFWLKGMDEALDQLCEEAETYIAGKRAQGELFDEGKRKGKGGDPETVGAIAGRIGKQS